MHKLFIMVDTILQFDWINNSTSFCHIFITLFHLFIQERLVHILDISEVQILPVSALNVVVGQSQVWLYCCVDNTSPVNSLTYRWVKWNSRNSSLVSSSQIYVIKTAKMEDSGTYVCTATNSFGNSSGSVDINVQCKIWLFLSKVSSISCPYYITSLHYRHSFQMTRLRTDDEIYKSSFLICKSFKSYQHFYSLE